MPKVKAGMADVSTEYVLIEPDTYNFRIETWVEEDAADQGPNGEKRTNYVVKSRVVAPGSDHHNKPVMHWISNHLKDGSLNEVALQDTKRFFEAIAPHSANSDDADTDELIGGMYSAEVYIDTYPDKRTGKDRQSNKINVQTVAPPL